MNRLPPTHPPIDELLLYLDGELRESRLISVRKHVEVCWKCRREAEELAAAASDYVRYQTAIDASVTPSGLYTSAALIGKLELLEAAPSEASFWSRLRPRFDLSGFGYAWRTIAAIAALATAWAAVGLVRRIVWAPERHTPTRLITSAPKSPIPTPAVSVPALAPPLMSKRVTGVAPAPVPIPGPSPEIAALVKLHELGADLGEAVETVAAPGGSVRVICRQLERERETEIRTALAGIPKVTVRTEAASPADPRTHARTTLSLGNGGGVLERALVERMGGKAQFDRLGNEILDDDDALMTRAYALHDIEERFPAGRRAALSVDDRAALEAVIADHQRVAIEKGAAIEARVAPLAKELGVVSGPVPPVASGLFAAAQRVDRILNISFGGSPSNLTLSQLETELNAALAQLHGALGALQ